MAGLLRQQNELNRGRAGRSIAFEAGRRGQERITDLSRMQGADPDKIRGLRSQATNVIYTGNAIGDTAGSREAARRMNVSISRYTRELNAAAAELEQRQRASGRNVNVNSSWQVALQDMQNAQAEINRASKKRFNDKLRQEEARQASLGIGVPVLQRIGGPTRRGSAIPMGGGIDSGIMPRALPSKEMLRDRVAGSQQRQPSRLDELQAAQQKQLAEEAKRAAGSLGRFGAAVEREEKRQRSLGIGAPSRERGGAIPMGGQGGRPGMFNQYAFPAGPGNPVGIGQFRAEQKRQQGQKGFLQGDARSSIGNAVIGGAFPALFGQGLGASAGGAAGGLVGGLVGGNFGFGLSLVGTAIGQAVDTTVNNLTELADAIRSPSKALDALEKSGLASSRGLEQTRLYVDQLTAVGRSYDAQTLVLQEVQKRLGPGSLTELGKLDTAQQKVQEQCGAIASEIQVRLLPVLQGFVEFLGNAAGDISGFSSQSRLERTDSKRFEQLRSQATRDSSRFAVNVAGVQLGFGGDKKKYEARLSELSKQELTKRFANERAQVPQTPQEKLAGEMAQIQESRKLADQIQSAYREAFGLQRQAYDLQRDGAKLNKDIADYSYKKEREVFDLRQQVAEKQIENNRARAQNRIEGSDLNARQTFAAAVGFEQQLLTNVREVVRSRKEGEADIEQSRNRLELAMAKLNRDVEDYRRTNAREIEDIEQRKLSYVRSVEDYKMKVADHVRDRAREAADLMRQAMTLPDMSAATAFGAPRAAAGSMTGRAPRTLMGTPGVVEYLTGDRSSPGYRADHGGSNYHEHIAFASRKIRDNVIAMLQRNGIQIGSTDGGSHAAGSYHYSGQAVDIPASQVPVGKEDALAKRVRALVAAYLGGSAGSSAQGQTATQISNIPGPRFSPVPIGPTPSIAPVNAANLAANLQLKGGTREAQQILEEQNKLKQKGIELGQIEQILQASQLPQLRQQGDTLKQQIEARQKILDLSDSAASVADIEAESRARITQLELDRSNALAKIKKQYGDDPALTGMVNKRADLAVGVAKNEEKQRRINLDLNNKLQNQERARSVILQLQETLATGKAEAAALERGKLQASNVELLKASELYQLASEAEKTKLALLAAQTEELGKQNEFRKRVNEIRSEARFTGAGLRAGMIGAPARAFEEEMKRSGNIDRATGLANETKLLENQQLVWGNLEKNIVATSDAISGALTNGLVSIVDGSRKIEDVGRDMLKAISGSFADSAQQQLTTLLQRQMGGLFQAIASQGLLSGLGGAGGLGGGLGAALSGSLGNIGSAFSTPTFGGFMAKGGTTKPGEGYIVGEKEPEFFFPGVTGRVVPRSDMQKAEALRNSGGESDSLDISYTVREEKGERYVTEDQLRKSNAMVERRAFAKTINGMKNNGALRDSINI
jgi:hypothetical protein